MGSKSSGRSRESEASLVACMDQTHHQLCWLLISRSTIGQDTCIYMVCVCVRARSALWVGYHRLLGGKDRPWINWSNTNHTLIMITLRLCLDVVIFTSIHMCWSGLGWNLIQVPLQPTPTHVEWCESDYIQTRPNACPNHKHTHLHLLLLYAPTTCC